MAISPATAQSYVDAIDAAVQTAITDGYAELDLEGVGRARRFSLKELQDFREYYAAIANAPQNNYSALPRRTHLRPGPAR